MRKRMYVSLLLVALLGLQPNITVRAYPDAPPAGTHAGQDNWCVCYGPHTAMGLSGSSGYTTAYRYDPMYFYVWEYQFDRFGAASRETSFPNQFGYTAQSCVSYCEGWARLDSDALCSDYNLGGGVGFTEATFNYDWTDTDNSGGDNVGSLRGAVTSENPIRRTCP
jgi:hypothetical protein